MSDRSFHQYFGPSPRYDRACVEMRFPAGEQTFRLAGLEAMLFELGFKLHEILPEEPLPLDAAICRLAGVLLARHKPWWSRHGSAEGQGWVAFAHPFPVICAGTLKVAHRLLTAGDAVSPPIIAELRELSTWLHSISKLRVWSLGAAEALSRDAITLVGTNEVYQVGQGAKGVHCYRMGTEFDAITGQKLEESKYTTVQLLRRLGIPTTRPALVHRLEEIPDAVARVGLPCVVKPLNLLQGEGVAPGLASEAEVEAAVARVLKRARPPVQIENHVEGEGYRFIVVRHELLWVYRRTPTAIVGDGTATVGGLIERENRRRAKIRNATDGYLQPLKAGEVLQRLLADRHGLELGSVIEAGRSIQVVAQANIAQGGYQEDVTGEVHPDNRELAIKVARLFRLHSTGVDLITPDISRSWKECPCAIIEVNRLPGVEGYGDVMAMHRTLFPNRLTGRIPTIAIIGSADYRARMARMAHAAIASAGLRAGQANYARRKTSTSQSILSSPGAPAVDTMLLDPTVEAAVILCEPDEVERAGFPLRNCDLALIEDEARFAWLAPKVEAVLVSPSPDGLHETIGHLAQTYADPAEGGPLPVIEPLEPAGNGEFRVQVWRARAMPRAWFWSQVGVAAPNPAGLTTHDDLLAAVRTLVDGGSGKLAAAFEYPPLPGSWSRVTFEASLAAPAGESRAALLAAIERVNQIAAAPIVPAVQVAISSR